MLHERHLWPPRQVVLCIIPMDCIYAPVILLRCAWCLRSCALCSNTLCYLCMQYHQ